ncbi:Sigma-70 region 2 [Mycoplasmopsis pulmonis]|nr:Sigma-70 region 2 [Mycoplasmopsis pulmonis]
MKNTSTKLRCSKCFLNSHFFCPSLEHLKLYEDYYPQIKSLARKVLSSFYSCSLEVHDLLNIAFFNWEKLVQDYDPTRNIVFEFYILKWMRLLFYQGIKNDISKRNSFLSHCKEIDEFEVFDFDEESFFNSFEKDSLYIYNFLKKQKASIIVLDIFKKVFVENIPIEKYKQNMICTHQVFISSLVSIWDLTKKFYDLDNIEEHLKS